MPTIVDWLSFRPATPANKVRSYIDLPSFSYANTWLGASEIITQFNFTASKNFVLRNRPTPPTGVNFCLCIRWRSGNTVYRWKLWQNVGEVLNVPLYNGEIIKKNFVLEVWTTNAGTISLDDDLRILTSVVSVPTSLYNLANVALATGTEVTKSDLAIDTGAVDVPGSPKYRWESNYGVGLSGSDVETWTDKIAGAVLSYEAGFFKPLYEATSAEINSKPMIRTIIGSSLQNKLLSFTPKTISLLFRQRTWVADTLVFEVSNGVDSPAKIRRDVAGTTPEVYLTLWTQEFGTPDTHIPVGVSTDYKHLLWQLDGDIVYIFDKDGNLNYSYNSSSSGSTVTCNTIILGGDSPFIQGALIDIAALVIWEEDLTSTQRATYLEYIKQTYSTGTPAMTLPATLNEDGAWLSND